MSNGRYIVHITMRVEVEDWNAVVEAAQESGTFADSDKQARYMEHVVTHEPAQATAAALGALVTPPTLDVPGARLFSGIGWSSQVNVVPDTE